MSMYLARKYSLITHVFYVSDGRRDSHFTWSSEPREGLAACTVAQNGHTYKLKMLLQTKNFTCKFKMLLQIKNRTYKSKIVHAN